MTGGRGLGDKLADRGGPAALWRGLLWPTHAYVDRGEADAVAGRGRARPRGPLVVPGATLDSFVAGSDGERFVVLIQVQDD